MTLENYNYRTNPLFLRNQFDESGDGAYKIPIIPKAEFPENYFNRLQLIGFDKTKKDDDEFTDRMVHFFLYDYKFEQIWKNPNRTVEKLKNYKAVLSPDFSMYREMNPMIQLYNTFRNRWCGAYLASKGIKVIPTVSWGDENTFDFCFLGIPKGSIVAVSTYMVSEHGNHKDQKKFFLKGYNEMLKRIEPARIICYNEPFPEMEGNIVFVDYELSSWKYQNKGYEFSEYVDYITGVLPLPPNSDILIKSGYILDADNIKGMGSAYGGEWKPKKEEDKRLLGKPGEIKTTYDKGYRCDVKIGEDGRAIKERHYTDHGQNHAHTNPHDHIINWEHPQKGKPNFIKPFINYYGKVPEFKKYKGGVVMERSYNNVELTPFESIADFKFSAEFGTEIQFVWKGKDFGIFAGMKETPDSPEQYFIAPSDTTEKEHKNKYPHLYADTLDKILNYEIDGDKLRDIITKVRVIWRNI